MTIQSTLEDLLTKDWQDRLAKSHRLWEKKNGPYSSFICKECNEYAYDTRTEYHDENCSGYVPRVIDFNSDTKLLVWLLLGKI